MSESIFTHRQRIVAACHPESREEAIELWHDIKSVKFGLSVELLAVPPPNGAYTLASYQIPEDASYMVIVRTEVYTFTFVPAAPDFGEHGPPPPGFALWRYTDIVTAFGNQYAITPRVAIHLLADAEEFLFAKGGNRVALTTESVPANPDANARFVRTLVYAYLIGPRVADRIGSGECTYFGTV